MLLLALRVTIELASGRPLWQDLIGPALIALTAIGAAAIAARTANTRQANQLKENRELQTNLLAQQLAHDREQRNRAHQRDVLDASVQNFEVTVQAGTKVLDVITRVRKIDEHFAGQKADPEIREAVDKVLDEQAEELAKARKAADQALIDNVLSNLRLATRFGSSHPVTRSQGAASDAIENLINRLRNVDASRVVEEELVEFDQLKDEMAERMASFLAACRNWLNS